MHVYVTLFTLNTCLIQKKFILKVLAPRNANHSSQYSFDDLDHSLDHMGLSEIVKQMVYEVLAAILHLCNVEFDDDLSQNAQILNIASLNNAAKLLMLDPAELADALTNQIFKTRAETSCISYVTWK